MSSWALPTALRILPRTETDTRTHTRAHAHAPQCWDCDTSIEPPPRAQRALTFLRQVILLSFCLHLFTPALDPLGVCVQQLHEPAPVPPQGGRRSARLGRRRRVLSRGGGFQLPRGLSAGLPGTGGLGGGSVVVSVAEEPLGAHGSHRAILGGRAGLGVALESAAELQALVLHDRETLQLHVSLHGCCHAVGALEPALPVVVNRERDAHIRLSETIWWSQCWKQPLKLEVFPNEKPKGHFLTLSCCPPPGSRQTGIPGSLYSQIRNLWLLPPDMKNVKSYKTPNRKQRASNYTITRLQFSSASAFIGLGLDGASELYMFCQKVMIYSDLWWVSR